MFAQVDSLGPMYRMEHLLSTVNPKFPSHPIIWSQVILIDINFADMGPYVPGCSFTGSVAAKMSKDEEKNTDDDEKKKAENQ